MAANQSNIAQLTFPGQVRIDRCTVTSANGVQVNLLNAIVGVQVFEDLYGYTTGKLIVTDALALTNVLPLQGTEVLDLSIITPTLNKVYAITGQFYLYNLSERTQDTDKSESYALGFCTREAIINVNKTISRAFAGRIDSLAASIISDERFLASALPFAIEPTSNSIKYVSNFWSPVKNLNFLAERATSQTDNAASYLFYQNRFGLNFKSLSSLYRQQPYQNFYIDRFTRDISVPYRDINSEFERALEWGYVGTAYDYLDMVHNGALSSTAFSYDPVRKNYTTSRFDYLGSFANTSHLNPLPLFGDRLIVGADAKIYDIPRDFASFTGWGEQMNVAVVQQRQSLLKQLASNRIRMVVYGRTDYTVGQKVNLYKYANKPTTANEVQVLDTEVTGSYLITAIQHFITVDRHECVLELSRDC